MARETVPGEAVLLNRLADDCPFSRESVIFVSPRSGEIVFAELSPRVVRMLGRCRSVEESVNLLYLVLEAVEAFYAAGGDGFEAAGVDRSTVFH